MPPAAVDPRCFACASVAHAAVARAPWCGRRFSLLVPHSPALLRAVREDDAAISAVGLAGSKVLATRFVYTGAKKLFYGALTSSETP